MKRKKKTTLWKIGGQDLPAPSFLFGTIHIKDQRGFKTLSKAYEKIDRCDAFATEFDLSDHALHFDTNLVLLPDNQSLQDLYSEKKYHKLKKAFAKYGNLDLDRFQHFLPIFIVNMLTEQVLKRDQAVSLDERLWEYAKEKGKITLGIETYQEQFDILNKIDLKIQLKMLSDIGKNFGKFHKQLHSMADDYEKGEIQKLYKSGKKSIGKLKKILLFDRNIVMADRIIENAKRQSIFVAVGVGHLAGKKGLLKLLKDKGYVLKGI